MSETSFDKNAPAALGTTTEISSNNSKEANMPATTAVPSHYPTGLSLGMILLSLALGTFLMALDTTIVSTAIPKISTEFKALHDVGWYGSAYLITLTAFQPITGNAYKNFDPKRTYLTFIVLFEGTLV